MTTILFTIIFLGSAIALLATRILLVKGGEFKGTCSSNNPMLKNELGECTLCGAKPEEACKSPEPES